MSSELPQISLFCTPTPPDLQQEIKKRVQILTNSKNRLSFPGSQPVSFEKKHLDTLLNQDYYVCEKSDGVRYLLFIYHYDKKPHAFFLDRKYEIKHCILNFPLRKEGYSHHDTLVDGEMVFDKINGKKVLNFYIFDILIMNGVDVMEKSFTSRLAKEELVKPLKSQQNVKFPFGVLMKEMFKSYYLPFLFHNVLPNLKHENDGLIFTPVNVGYVLGTCSSLLKWKPGELNTVDFVLGRIRRRNETIFTLNCLDKDQSVFYDFFTPEKDGKDWESYEGSIIECKLDMSWSTRCLDELDAPFDRAYGWRFIRFRNDKETPNQYKVIQKILNSIKDNVTMKELEDIASDVKNNWLQREEKKKETKTIEETKSRPAEPADSKKRKHSE